VTRRLTAERLSLADAARELEGPGLGGVVLFAGRTRPDRFGATRVVALDYEVHLEPALRLLERLDRAARARYAVERTVLWHRVGRVPVGEVSVIVGAAAPHRAPAFAAARFLIDRLKATVPIWKMERARRARRRRPRPVPRAGRSAD
jgi:molybdopterin synthase catalytic subunit